MTVCFIIANDGMLYNTNMTVCFIIINDGMFYDTNDGIFYDSK